MTNGRSDAETERGRQGAEGGDGPAAGEGLPAPNPDYSPETVLKLVLRELRTNDAPHENAGIRTVFNFASPVYRKQSGGSFDEFVDHITGPIHRTLVDYAGAKRGRLRMEDDEAVEKVVIEDEDGDETTYEFTLTKVDQGKYEGCWMIDEIELVYVGASPDHQHMPVVEFDGVEVKCKEGDILREVLLRASGISPYNDAAQYANCGGHGLCGTCAVEILDGEVTEKTAQEKRRLKLPPHEDTDDPNFRLACQTRVMSDLQVHKHEGTWGHHIEEYAKDTDETADAEPIRVTDDEYEGNELEEIEEIFEATERTAQKEDDELDLSDEAESLLDETAELLDERDEE